MQYDKLTHLQEGRVTKHIEQYVDKMIKPIFGFDRRELFKPDCKICQKQGSNMKTWFGDKDKGAQVLLGYRF